VIRDRSQFATVYGSPFTDRLPFIPMGFHIVSVDAPQCSLSCKDGQLTCRVGDEKPRTLPIEDVASIIITSFSASLHSHLLLEAARHGVALIICEEFKPASILLPANRCTDTLLTRSVQQPTRNFFSGESVVGRRPFSCA
jgi:hypothetical protein